MLTLHDAQAIVDIREWSDRACEDYRERTGHPATGWFRLLANCNGDSEEERVVNACRAVLRPNDLNWYDILTYDSTNDRLHCSVEWAATQSRWERHFTADERQRAQERLSHFPPKEPT